MAKVTIHFGGQEVGTHNLTKPAMVIGRDPSSDIVIDNLGVSRSHCQLLRRGLAYVVQDMNSANGTWVNGERVGEHYLNDGDKIGIGKYIIVFGNPEQAVAAQAGQRIVPDSLNTYMMDGDAIRQRLEQLKSDPAAPGAAPDTAAPAALAAPAGLQAQPAAPAARGPRGDIGTLKLMLGVSLLLNFLFLVCLIVMLLHMRDMI